MTINSLCPDGDKLLPKYCHYKNNTNHGLVFKYSEISVIEANNKK